MKCHGNPTNETLAASICLELNFIVPHGGYLTYFYIAIPNSELVIKLDLKLAASFFLQNDPHQVGSKDMEQSQFNSI